MSIGYRKAVLNDEERLFILAASLATSFQLNKSDFAKVFLELLDDNNVDLIVAERELKLIGYVVAFHHSTFYADGLICLIEEIFVLEEFRGKGIGKKMMSVIEERAIERGSKLIALATRRAGRFYEAIGFNDSATYYKKGLAKM